MLNSDKGLRAALRNRKEVFTIGSRRWLARSRKLTLLHLFMTVKVGLQYIEIQGGNTWLKWKYSIVNCVDIC